MTPFEETLADYARRSLTDRPARHGAPARRPARARASSRRATSRSVAHGARCASPGHVIVRQRPGTAKGMCFLTLEDETGTANAFLTPPLFERWRVVLNTSPLLEVDGPLEHVGRRDARARARRCARCALRAASSPPSHDYR